MASSDDKTIADHPGIPVPRMTPIWEKQKRILTEAFATLMADPQARLRWFHFSQCLTMAGALPRERFAQPADSADRAKVEALHAACGSDLAGSLRAMCTEVQRAAPDIAHSLGPTLPNWIFCLTFDTAGVSPLLPRQYGLFFLAGNPLWMDASGAVHGVAEASAQQILEVKAALDSLRPERKRGPRRRTAGDGASVSRRALDPQRCQAALEMFERHKTHSEIALKLFGPEILSDPKAMERYRGKVRRMIDSAKNDRYQRSKNPQIPQKPGR